MYETIPGHALRIFALISCEPSREQGRERGQTGGQEGQEGQEGGSDARPSRVQQRTAVGARILIPMKWSGRS